MNLTDISHTYIINTVVARKLTDASRKEKTFSFQEKEKLRHFSI